MKRTAIAICLGLGLLVAACTTPRLQGDGVLRRAVESLATGSFTELHVVFEDKFILCETTGPFHRHQFYDPSLRPERARQYDVRKLALSHDGTRGAGLAGKGVHILVVPEMSLLHEAEKPASAIMTAAWVGPLPEDAGWVVTSGDPSGPNVWLLTGELPTFGKSGRTELSAQARGRAIDDKTGYLVTTGHGNKLEIFDLESMKSVLILELPCRQVSYSLAARNGVAWVGTMEGTVIPVDIEKRSAGKAVRFGAGPGEVELSLSVSGNYMGVVAQDQREKSEPFPTSLRVFRIKGTQLFQSAKGYLEPHGALDDVEILENAGIVVFSAGGSLFGWFYQEKP
ncbi:MAG: hypothetical protein ACYS99_08135 [Planctomycetota bacterium]|jgi:hypothetical protein